MEKRRKFQGVLNILSFNRHFYVYGLLAVAALFLSRFFIEWPDFLFWVIIAAFIYGLTMPLIVSTYMYDFSGYYNFHWLSNIISNTESIKSIANINAGFDETSFIIQNRFPASALKVFDFYNPKRHTEPAIKRARKVSLVFSNTKIIASNAIPLGNNSVDIVFLLSAAHEIRLHEERIQFLKECHRICKPGGSVIMVEHLRNFPNFLAFSVGFTHFFSQSVWKNAYKSAGFTSIEQSKFTLFMSIFKCKP